MNIHDNETLRAYEKQERASVLQYNFIFHAYNLYRYIGMLRSLFCIVGKTDVSSIEIQENDAFKCSILAAGRLDALFGEPTAKHEPALLVLWHSTNNLISSVSSARSAGNMLDVLTLLHVAAVVFYEYLQRRFLDDACICRRIDPDQSLISFAAKLRPIVNLHADDDGEVCRRLAKSINLVRKRMAEAKPGRSRLLHLSE